MSYFYIMQEDSTGIFKVGVSDEPLIRRISLSTPTNPMILLWAWQMSRTDALRIEREIVSGFANQCVKGREYFHLNESDMLLIHALITPELAHVMKRVIARNHWFDKDNVLRDKNSAGFILRDHQQTPERRRTRTVEVNPDNPEEIIRVIHPYSKHRKGEFQRQSR